MGNCMAESTKNWLIASQLEASFSALHIQQPFLQTPRSTQHGRRKTRAQLQSGSCTWSIQGRAGNVTLVTSSRNMRSCIGGWSSNGGVMSPHRVSSKVAAAIMNHGDGASPAVRAPFWMCWNDGSQRDSAVSDGNQEWVVFEMCPGSSHSCRSPSTALGSISFTPSPSLWSLVLGAGG